MRKYTYIAALIVIAGLLAILIFLQTRTKEEIQEAQPARTVVPILKPEQQTTNSTAANNDNVTNNIQSEFNSLKLFDNEVLIHATTVDVDQNGTEDYVFAVKKLSDTMAYLVIALQDTRFTNPRRAAEVRTAIARIKTINFSAIDSPDSNLPAIVCTGITSENTHVLTIYAPKITAKGDIQIETLADLRADGQIVLREVKNMYTSDAVLYDIYTYNTDPNAQSTLDQIEQAYQWDPDTHSYKRYKETWIPGKKIESQVVKKLKSGNPAAFKDFLSGLWFKPTSKGKSVQSLYFDNTAAELIFDAENTQEVFTIEASSSRHYGIYLTTKNQSISSIIRRIDIQLTGVDEIRVRVIENVARLKIGTASSWDGIYQKQHADRNRKIIGATADIQAVSEFMQKFPAAWTLTNTTAAKTQLRFMEKTYEKTENEKTELGRYVLDGTKTKPMIQLKKDGENTSSEFFLVQTAFDKKTNTATLTLTPILNTLDAQITQIGEPLVFTQQHNK